jgi:hypothetical protein
MQAILELVDEEDSVRRRGYRKSNMKELRFNLQV